MAYPEAWGPYFLFSIQRRGASAQSEIQFAAIVDPTTFAVTLPEKPTESVVNAAGGRIYKFDPEGDGEITFDILPTELDTTSGVGLFQQYLEVSGTADPNPYDATTQLDTDTSWPAGVNRVRDKFRLVTLDTNDVAATAASAATTASTNSLRFFANNCIFVNMELNRRDNQLKAAVTFKFKPFTKAGTVKNYGFNSYNSNLGALTAYTTANFPD